MNKILIITTKGCEGCQIAKYNVEQAINNSKKQIELEVKDCSEVDKKFIYIRKVSDFPTVFYFIDDAIIHKTIGSYPSVVYLHWIKMYFK